MPLSSSTTTTSAIPRCQVACIPEKRLTLTLFPCRGIPQPRLSAAARLGRPARASESSADCATRWSWSPRPGELTVGASAVPRVVERMAGSCQPIYVIRRHSWITAHITISASPARAPLAARVAQGRVDERQGTRVRCSRSLISHRASFPSSRRCLALKTLARHVVKTCFRSPGSFTKSTVSIRPGSSILARLGALTTT